MVEANTPVIVGVGVVGDRNTNSAIAAWPEASQLMSEATMRAVADAGADGAEQQLEAVAAMSSQSGYRDPAGLVAKAVGSPDAHTVRADPGILQQAIFSKICNWITAGEMDLALMVSGEASWRAQQARFAGIEAAITDDSHAEPSETISPEFIIHEAELAVGLNSAVSHYSVLENSYRAHHGQSMSEQAAETGQLWQRFSEVASQNPDAWNRNVTSAPDISEPTAKNRMMAFPYTKRHCSQMNVDQAAAILFCSAGKAEALGIPKDKWVFPLGAAISNHTVAVVQRSAPYSSAGFHHIGQRIAELTGVSPADADFVDLYSCFPVAVKVQAGELGLDLDRQLTVTGGMAFAGGPLNSYVLHSLVKTVRLLRENPQARGFITSISGMITKQGIGMFSATPPESAAVFEDATQAVSQITQPLPIDDKATGEAVAVSYTVLYDRDGDSSAGSVPSKAVVVAEFGGDRPTRRLVTSTDPDIMGHLISAEADEFCNSDFRVLADGTFAL